MPASRRCSRSVARPSNDDRSCRRSRADPLPVVPAIVESVSATSATVSVATSAGTPRASASVAQPTPMRPPGIDPVRNATAGAASSGSARRSTAASAATFAFRFEVDATRSDASARSSNRRAIIPVSPVRDPEFAALPGERASRYPRRFCAAATSQQARQRYVGPCKAPATVPGSTGRTSGDGRPDTWGEQHDRHDRTV